MQQVRVPADENGPFADLLRMAAEAGLDRVSVVRDLIRVAGDELMNRYTEDENNGDGQSLA